MNAKRSISVFALLLWGAAADARQGVPVTFARSGEAVTAEVLPTKADGARAKMLLTAYGRVWTPPAVVRNGAVTFKVPKVRAPAIFKIVPANNVKKAAGEIVAYPPQDVRWDEKIALWAAAPPKWFRQWAGATGLPVQYVERKVLAAKEWPKSNSKKARSAVLIVGREAAGDRFECLLEPVIKHKLSVVILEAEWFGEVMTPKRPVELGPGEMTSGPLADIGKQSWVKPLKFASRQLPWGEITNRQAWIVSYDHPQVEQVRGPGVDPARIVLSYVPWSQQLGRVEDADPTFLRLLEEAGKVTPTPATLDAHLRIVNPVPADEREKDDAAGPREPCPVLAAALKCQAEGRKGPEGQRGPQKPEALTKPEKQGLQPHDRRRVVHVLDLRGDRTLKDAQAVGRLAGGDQLLILGDDSVLDRLKALRLKRNKRRSARHDVEWVWQDEPPATLGARVRAMQALTRNGVTVRRWRLDEEKDHGKGKKQ